MIGLFRCSRPILAANAWSNRTTMRTGDWICRCGFVVPKIQTTCPECKLTMQHKIGVLNQSTCKMCHVSNHGDRVECWNCQAAIDKTSIQRSADVRVVRSWKCARCTHVNPLAAAICTRCERFR